MLENRWIHRLHLHHHLDNKTYYNHFTLNIYPLPSLCQLVFAIAQLSGNILKIRLQFRVAGYFSFKMVPHM